MTTSRYDDSHPGWRATMPPRRETQVGAAIRQWCLRTGVSQTRLAEHLDCHHTYISRIAAGERLPTRDLAEKIADALGITHADMALMLWEIDPQAYRAGIEADARRAEMCMIRDEADDD